MTEYLSEAVVLDKETNGDLDLRISFFTKKFGKLRVKAKSGRKILSKLSPHTEPGNVVQARIIEKGGLQVVDVLKRTRLETAPRDLYFLNQLLHEGEPDLRLWNVLISRPFAWAAVLEILGWDPREGFCVMCTGKPSFFYVPRQELFCTSCASKFRETALLCLTGN